MNQPTLNYPKKLPKSNWLMQEKLKWTFPWVKHGQKVKVIGRGYSGEKIYDPSNRLQKYFDEVSDVVDDDDDLLDLFSDTIISIIDMRGIDQEVYLSMIKPYWNSNPQIGREWQWECEHCEYRSTNRDEREVWNYMGSGTNEGRCFSCGLHHPDDIENERFEE